MRRILTALALCLALAPGGAAAQCVMCSLTAEAVDTEGASRTLAAGILVLLLPTLGLLGGAGALLWRYRGEPSSRGADGER